MGQGVRAGWLTDSVQPLLPLIERFLTMANTLTSLDPTIYESLDVVSREMVGFIPAVSRDSSAERAALNQSILVPVTPAQAAADNTPGVTPPNTGDQTIANVSMTISKSK